jgi:hypothetical protein
MKKRTILAATAGAAMLTSGALAVPYASQIKTPTAVFESGSTISYVLNMPATSVTIRIFSDGQNPSVDTPVASFAGTTAAGVNTVVWDGTNNNSGGTHLPIGSNYFATVQVVGATAAGWAEFASNRSVGNFGPTATLNTIFNGFSGNDVYINKNEESDQFGVVAATSSYGTPLHRAVILFNSDLSITGGDDGLASRVLRHARVDSLLPAQGTNQATWGIGPDPDDVNRIWISGQDPAGVGYAPTNTEFQANQQSHCILTAANADGWFDQTLSTADANSLIAALMYPRTIAVARHAAGKFAYVTRGNGGLSRVPIDNNNQITGPAIESTSNTWNNVLAITATRYSKAVQFDNDGNLYWVSRDVTPAITTTGDGGRLYRWNAADVEASASGNTFGALTDANAAWVVQLPAGALRALDVAIDPTNGDVYVLNGVGTPRGVWRIANKSTASLGTDASPHIPASGDLVIDLTTIGTGWTMSTFGAGMDFDKFGNLYLVDRSGEQVRGFTQGGASNLTVSAPASQAFNIVGSASARPMWHLYE